MNLSQKIAFYLSCLLIGMIIGSALARADQFEVTELPTYSSKTMLEKSSDIFPKGSKPLLKIAIIDTGYIPAQAMTPIKLCKTGHFDFGTGKALVGSSGHPHGTQVASLVAQGLVNVNYCALIYNVEGKDGFSFKNISGALRKAKEAGAVAINMSIQGYQFSYLERMAIEELSASGIHLFVAAGNDNMNLDEACNSYPGCYQIPRVHMVGSILPDYSGRSSFSNYGTKVELWYPGYYVTVFETARGTSFASPRALADYVSALASRL